MSDVIPTTPPAPEYQVVYPVGVRHLPTGRVIKPDWPEWAAYQSYLSTGGDLAPADPDPPLSESEALARLELSERFNLLRELRGDPALQALRARTPAQVDAWIDANVTTLAQAREVLKTLARIVALIARERL